MLTGRGIVEKICLGSYKKHGCFQSANCCKLAQTRADDYEEEQEEDEEEAGDEIDDEMLMFHDDDDDDAYYHDDDDDGDDDGGVGDVHGDGDGNDGDGAGDATDVIGRCRQRCETCGPRKPDFSLTGTAQNGRNIIRASSD